MEICISKLIRFAIYECDLHARRQRSLDLDVNDTLVKLEYMLEILSSR